MNAVKTATPDGAMDGVMGDVVVEHSSGNVFEDLGLPDAEERLAKALLARAISQVIEDRDWRQTRADDAAGLTASDLRDIARGKLAKMSIGRLSTIILNLGMDIEIRIKPAAGVTTASSARRGRISVDLAEAA